MRVGSIVIANDLLGYCVSLDDKYCSIKDHKGVVRKVLSKSVTEVAHPHAQALLTYNKLVSRIRS